MYRKLQSLFGPILMVFDADPGSPDPNNPNPADPGAAKAGGGGGAKADTHVVKIAGEERTLSTEELIELASKSAGADQVFREAAEMRKGAEKSIRRDELIKSISDSETINESEVRELAAILGVDPDEFLAELQSDDGSKPAKPTKNTSNMSKAELDKYFQEEFGASPAEVKAILEHSQHRHVQDARREIREISDKAVDKDSIIGKMIVGEDKDEVLSTVKEMVLDDVLRKIKDGGSFGAELVQECVQRVRNQLTRLGIPKKLNQNPLVLGLGPGVELPSEIQADEPIKRISSADDTDESNMVKRWLQKGIKAHRERR